VLRNLEMKSVVKLFALSGAIAMLPLANVVVQAAPQAKSAASPTEKREPKSAGKTERPVQSPLLKPGGVPKRPETRPTHAKPSLGHKLPSIRPAPTRPAPTLPSWSFGSHQAVANRCLLKGWPGACASGEAC
jgi:hypothetical protein